MGHYAGELGPYENWRHSSMGHYNQEVSWTNGINDVGTTIEDWESMLRDIMPRSRIKITKVRKVRGDKVRITAVCSGKATKDLIASWDDDGSMQFTLNGHNVTTSEYLPAFYIPKYSHRHLHGTLGQLPRKLVRPERL